MTQVTIEPATGDDLSFLAEMVALTIKSLPHVATWSPLEIEIGTQLELTNLGRGLDPAFIARWDGTPAGAVWLRSEGEPGALQFTLGIAVAPPYRRRGVGSFLMDFILEYCTRNNGAWIGLKVHPGNLAAMRLYRQFGFEEVTLEMRKRLRE